MTKLGINHPRKAPTFDNKIFSLELGGRTVLAEFSMEVKLNANHLQVRLYDETGNYIPYGPQDQMLFDALDSLVQKWMPEFKRNKYSHPGEDTSLYIGEDYPPGYEKRGASLMSQEAAARQAMEAAQLTHATAETALNAFLEAEREAKKTEHVGKFYKLPEFLAETTKAHDITNTWQSYVKRGAAHPAADKSK